jgi:hypothetical protein
VSSLSWCLTPEYENLGVTQRIGAERAPAPLASTKRAQALIEVTAEAWSSDPLALPGDTRQALATDGRAELLKSSTTNSLRA